MDSDENTEDIPLPAVLHPMSEPIQRKFTYTRHLSLPYTNAFLEIPDADSSAKKNGTKDVKRVSITSIKSETSSVGEKHPRKRLSATFESFDYNVAESQRLMKNNEDITPQKVQRASILMWSVNFLIGLFVAMIAVVVALFIKYISKYKFLAIYKLLESRDTIVSLLPACAVWLTINCVLTFIGSCMVTYIAPQAAGSGIPQIKCYLNGVKLPGLLSVKTLLAKAGGVVLSVCGGLACGKEGPMIHSGAIIASGLANSEIKCGKKTFKPEAFESLRYDDERRDFVAAGAASGVSAAFAAPIGGVLFSLEEGASFLNQKLTWRMMFSSMTASLFLNIIMSAVKGHPEDMSSPGLVSLGHLGDISYQTTEILIFMAMAVFGGLSGALFIQINYKITLLRRRFITKNWAKVLETVIVAALSMIVIVSMIYGMPDCKPIKGYNMNSSHTISEDPSQKESQHKRDLSNSNTSNHDEHLYGEHGSHGYVFQGFCPYGQHNRMADILFKTPEGGLHAMLNAPADEWSVVPLIVLLLVYHLLATVTYGIMVSSGVFIPSLLIGAIWGRLVGIAVMNLSGAYDDNISKYSLIGAACQLGGTVRMTISLTVIILECTGDITFCIPIMLSLVIAKWMGDFFNPGIYDLHIEVMGIPLLPWEPPEMSHSIKAREIMGTPVVVLRLVEKIGNIIEILNGPNSHNGFPVVENYNPKTQKYFGTLKGFIKRSTLQRILFGENEEVSEEEMDATIDLKMHMDLSPYSIEENISLPRIFKMFRGLGLRHLVCVNDRNYVTGIITRINLARFREESIKGKLKFEELLIEDK